VIQGLTAKRHASWFIGWACLGIIIGTGLCAVLNPHLFADSALALVAASLILLCLVKRLRWMLLLVFCAGSLFGLWRGSCLKVSLEAYRPYYDRVVVLQGRVSQDVSYGAKGDQRLNLAAVVIDGKYFAGEVWASTARTDIKRGDAITLKGKLGQGFGNLSATMYRAQIVEIVRPSPGDIARRVRDWFGEGVRKAIPEPQVSLGLGYLLGQQAALPKALEEQIKIVGLTHAVVASGYNLTILVVFSRKLFSKVSKYFATMASAVMVGCFMMVTGLSPSMTRAGFVAILGLMVWYYGRKMHPFILLSFAAAVTAVVNPSYVWGDLGWYLSFGSFIGVIILAPLLQHYFWGLQENAPMLRQLLVDTLSAQIVTLPIIQFSFGLYSVYALPANIMVLPLVPLAMLFTFIAGVGGLVLPGFATLIGFPATLILRYSTEAISRWASLPNAQTEFKFNAPVMIASYIVLGIAITYLIRRTKHDFRDPAEPEKY
jgi:competence protein ComEC